MNFINSLTSWQWGVLALVPPAIVLLYFLKLKRQPVQVPSTYLWSRTIEDLHVNSIWQRLRQSLLLFLQLLLVALVMLACLRPGWRGTELLDERIVFLIDNSASMSATDIEPTRLAVAKQRVLALIEQMNSNQVAMVISFSDAQRVEQSFTNNRSLLRQKVNRIQPSSRRTDLSEALRAAAGLANPNRTSEAGTSDVQVADALPATLYIFSDGGFASVPDFSLGNLTPHYIALGVDAPANVAIVGFSTERNIEKPDQTQAYTRLENSGTSDVTVLVELYLNDQLIDASTADVPAGGAKGFNFELPALEEGVLRLQLRNRDHLALDDQAYSVVNVPRRARVLLVTPGNDALRFALMTSEARRAADVSVASPDVLGTREHHDLILAGTYDLVIYDQCVPEKMPEANTLFVGNVPPLETWSAGESKPMPVIIDTDPVHPLTHFVEMGNVTNYAGFAVQGPEGAAELFSADSGSDNVPLLVVGHREGFEDAVLGIEILGPDASGNLIPKTDWPIRRSFPIFIMNVLRYLGGARAAMATSAVQPGMTISLRSIHPVDRLRIDSPSGGAHEVLREGQNRFVFSRTHELGIYEVREEGARDVSQRFAVNLFDSRESDLRPQRVIELGYEEVVGRAALEPSRRELWKWLMIAGLVILLFEWYVYNRRVYL